MTKKKDKFSTSSKREQFTGKEKSKLPLFAAVAALLVVAVIALLAFSGGEDNEVAYSAFGEPLANTRSYMGEVVSMTRVEAAVDQEWASMPLDMLEEADIVYFEVENLDGFMVPMMAYITPSGRIFAGSSMCEPCQGRYFSLAGETLVCDSCRTTYTIESHEFISGSADCGSLPPVYMEPVVEDGMVRVSMQDILQWEIRAY